MFCFHRHYQLYIFNYIFFGTTKIVHLHLYIFYELFTGELLHVLSLSKPKVMFCSARTISKMLQVQNDHPYLQKLVLFGNETKPNGRVELFNDIIRGEKPVVKYN